MSDLRLGKRGIKLLRLGKRSVPNLRLGKRAIPKMRLGKRSGMTAATLRYLVPTNIPPTLISLEMAELLKHPEFTHQLIRLLGNYDQLTNQEKRTKNAIRIIKKENFNNFDNEYEDDEYDDNIKEEDFS